MPTLIHTVSNRLIAFFLFCAVPVAVLPMVGSAQTTSGDVSADTLARFCAEADVANAIGASFASSGGVTVTESGQLQTDVQVVNQGPVTVHDATVYVAIYPASSDVTDALPVAVEAAVELAEIAPGYAETHTIAWEPPAHLSAGSYEARLHVSQSAADLIPHELASKEGSQAVYPFTLTRTTTVAQPVIRTTIGSETYSAASAGVPYEALGYTGSEPLPVTVQVWNPAEAQPYEGEYEIALHRGLSTDPAGVVASSSKSVRLVPGAETTLTLSIESADLNARDTVVVRRMSTTGPSDVVGYYPLQIDGASTEAGTTPQPALTYHGAYQGASIACWDVSSIGGDDAVPFTYEFQLAAESGSASQVTTLQPDDQTDAVRYMAVLAPSISPAQASVASLSVGIEGRNGATEFDVVTQHTQTSSVGSGGVASGMPPYEKANAVSTQVLFISIVATAGLLGILLLYALAHHYGRRHNS